MPFHVGNALLFVRVVTVIGAVAAFAVAAFAAYRRRALKGFLPVPATVVTSWVEEVKSLSAPEAGPLDSVTYLPRVRYAYEVDGTRYESTVLGAFVRHTSRRSEALASVAELRPGAAVTAFVNPRDPKDATLRTDVPSTTIVLFFAIGLAFLLAGGAASFVLAGR